MGKRTRSLGFSLLLSFLGATTAVAFVPTAPAQAASVNQTYLHFNMCGNVCNGGSLDVANDVINSINSHNPQPFIVTLNEICANQYQQLWTMLAPYYGQFIATGPTCANGELFGIAILVRTTSYSWLGTHTLPNPGGNEVRKIGCLQTSATGGGSQPLVACVTHIDHHSVNIGPQIQDVAGWVTPYWQGNHVMVGGDFNVYPGDSRLNPMYRSVYSPAGTGIFNEADAPPNHSRTGYGGSGTGTVYNEYTHCSSYSCGYPGGSYSAYIKIDYIFLSNLDFTGYTADATYAIHSDHTPLWSSATFV